jgi:hypothetical protein
LAHFWHKYLCFRPFSGALTETRQFTVSRNWFGSQFWRQKSLRVRHKHLKKAFALLHLMAEGGREKEWDSKMGWGWGYWGLNSRQALFHLSHATSPFCWYFGNMVLLFCPSRPGQWSSCFRLPTHNPPKLNLPSSKDFQVWLELAFITTQPQNT